jgi:hypothetical protein
MEKSNKEILTNSDNKGNLNENECFAKIIPKKKI